VASRLDRMTLRSLEPITRVASAELMSVIPSAKYRERSHRSEQALRTYGGIGFPNRRNPTSSPRGSPPSSPTTSHAGSGSAASAAKAR
jgi:hypothetical protein